MTHQAQSYLDKKMWQRLADGTREAVLIAVLMGIIVGFGLCVLVLT